VKFSPALRLFLVVLLPLTVGWKLTMPSDNSDEVNNSIVEFLKRNQFSAVVTREVDETYVVSGRSADCRLFVTKVLPLGKARDQVQHLASPSDRTFVVYRGKIFGEQPRLRTIVDFFLSKFLSAVRVISEVPPVLAVVSSCDAATQLPWNQLKFPG